MKGEESVYLFSKVTIELCNSKLRYQQRKRHRYQWSRRGSPETDPHKHAQLRSKSKPNGGTRAVATDEAYIDILWGGKLNLHQKST